MNAFGLIVGIATLLIIGLGFPLVIQGERRFGYLWWPYMLGIGVLIIGVSLFVPVDWLSVVIGAIGATFIWGSTELKEQAVRAELGWFLSKPIRSNHPLRRSSKGGKPRICKHDHSEMKAKHILVVGGGIAGLSAAYNAI